MWNSAVGDSLFRAEMPRPDDAALTAHISRLLDRLKQMAESPSGLQGAVAARRSFSPKRSSYHLPTFETPESYTVRSADLKVVRRGQDWLLLSGGLKLPLTAVESRLASWIAQTKSFDADQFAAAFPGLDQNHLTGILAKLASQNIIAKG